MMSAEEIIKIGKKYEKNIHSIIRENRTYKLDELRSYQRDSAKFCAELKGFKIIMKNILSRRRALIVILQEYYYNEIEYPEKIILRNYEEKAKSRFIIKQRKKDNLRTAQDIHPKKPREFYEDRNHKMRHYKESLELLSFIPESYFEKEEAIEPLINLYHDLIE